MKNLFYCKGIVLQMFINNSVRPLDGDMLLPQIYFF